MTKPLCFSAVPQPGCHLTNAYHDFEATLANRTAPCDNEHIGYCYDPMLVSNGAPDESMYDIVITSAVTYTPEHGGLYRRNATWTVHSANDTTYVGTSLAQALAAFAKDHEAKP